MVWFGQRTEELLPALCIFLAGKEVRACSTNVVPPSIFWSIKQFKGVVKKNGHHIVENPSTENKLENPSPRYNQQKTNCKPPVPNIIYRKRRNCVHLSPIVGVLSTESPPHHSSKWDGGNGTEWKTLDETGALKS